MKGPPAPGSPPGTSGAHPRGREGPVCGAPQRPVPGAESRRKQPVRRAEGRDWPGPSPRPDTPTVQRVSCRSLTLRGGGGGGRLAQKRVKQGEWRWRETDLGW